MPSARGFATAVFLILLVLAVTAIAQRISRREVTSGGRKRLAVSGVVTLVILAALAIVAVLTR